ncbi:hypothetical protein PAGU2595_017740 [Lysobacter xanthus]
MAIAVSRPLTSDPDAGPSAIVAASMGGEDTPTGVAGVPEGGTGTTGAVAEQAVSARARAGIRTRDGVFMAVSGGESEVCGVGIRGR